MKYFIVFFKQWFEEKNINKKPYFYQKVTENFKLVIIITMITAI